MTQTSEPGKKFDSAKLPLGRGFVNYFARAMQAVAAVSRYGAQKYKVTYEDKNWERLDDARLRYGDGRQRHIVDEAVDGPWDPESKLLHAAHAAWNAMAYLELCLREGQSLIQPETDNGPNPDFIGRKLEDYSAPVQSAILAGSHMCVGITPHGHRPGYSSECEACKMAIYGPREL